MAPTLGDRALHFMAWGGSVVVRNGTPAYGVMRLCFGDILPQGRRLCAVHKLSLLVRPSPEGLSWQGMGRAWEVRARVPQLGAHLG